MKLDKEIQRLKAKIAADSMNFPVYTELGNALLKAGKLQEAKKIFFHVLSLQPEDPDFLNDYGVALQKLGENQEATQQFLKVLDINPNHELANSNLGYVLNVLGDLKGAVFHCKKALKVNPNNANTLNNYGVVLHQLQKMNAAILALIKATKLRPDSPVTFRNLGLSLQAIGRFKEARAAFRHAIALAPNEGITYRYIAEITTYEKFTREVKIMKDTLANVPEESECAKNIHFALGKVFNDLKKHDKSMYHLFMGNKLHRKTLNYHPKSFEALTDRIINTFPPDMEYPKSINEETPIFIVGMPRSGSTLIEQILASHSDVYAAGEIKNLNKNTVKLVELLSRSGKEYPEGMSDFDEEGLTGLGKSYLDTLKPLSNKKFISNKMSGNCFYIGLILMALPNARIIHTLRDPVDTCFSCFTKYFSDSHHYTYNLRELGRYYKNYARLMEHWHKVFPGRILDVQYEKVVKQQKNQTKNILKFCGLEWEDSCMSFHETKRIVLTASANQVRSPIYQSAVNRSEGYREYLGPLLKELGLSDTIKKNKKKK